MIQYHVWILGDIVQQETQKKHMDRKTSWNNWSREYFYNYIWLFYRYFWAHNTIPILNLTTWKYRKHYMQMINMA